MNSKVGVVGATGAVGQEIVRLLEERNFPLSSLRCFASPRSKGQIIPFRKESIPIETMETFQNIDLAFFCAGSALSREWRARANCLVIDASSAFRRDPNVPLIIPEINAHAMRGSWIASPNCAATVLLMPLFQLHRAFRVKRIVVSTYQAASGGGARLLKELEDETQAHCEGKTYPPTLPLPYPFNLYPHNSALDASGYVEEELKMRDETRKIL